MFVFHYNTPFKVNLMLRAGVIRRTPWNPGLLAKRELPVTWFSSNDHWGPTPENTKLREDTGERTLMTIKEQSEIVGVCRFKFDADSIPNLMDWETIKRLAEIPSQRINALTNAMNAKPHEWFGTIKSVHIHPSICTIQEYNHNTDSWVTKNLSSTR